MVRSSLALLIAASAAGFATGSVQAGGCIDPCGAVVAAVSAPVAPFYLVDQGPVYYGPGVTRGPTYFESGPSHLFPYVGSTYYWIPAAPPRIVTVSRGHLSHWHARPRRAW
jgi:hypothetical protein